MKIEIDRNGRKIYKFNHSVVQGGYLYAHKSQDIISDKTALRNALISIIQKYELIDSTIKVYDKIFFMFCMTKPMVKPADIINNIHTSISPFAKWDEEYIWTTVYDLQEKNVREYLKKCGMSYDEG